MKAYFAGRIGDGECDRVFYRTDQDGKRVPVHQDALDSAHGRAREKAGLVDLRFYDFRHDAVSRLLSLGFNDHQIMQMAGWKTNMVNHYNCRDRVRLSEIGARLMYQGNSDAKAVNQ
jgi:integrase